MEPAPDNKESPRTMYLILPKSLLPSNSNIVERLSGMTQYDPLAQLT